VFSVLGGVLALASGHVAVLTAGSAVGVAIEAGLPWVTRGMQVRRAARLANQVSRTVAGRKLTARERQRILSRPDFRVA
jgi:hypothetical protein